MTALYWIVLALVIVGLLAVAAQQYRYVRARRDVVADTQELFHPSSAFHVTTVVALSPGQELLAGARELVSAIESNGAQVVYAGKIAVNAMASNQLPDQDWDAFVLAQYPSREAYAASATNPDYQKALAGFAASYSLGMQRSAAFNLVLPVALLGRRIADIVQRRPARFPFKKA